MWQTTWQTMASRPEEGDLYAESLWHERHARVVGQGLWRSQVGQWH
jgi:hypothetical protein